MSRGKLYFEFYDNNELIGIFTAQEIRERTDCGIKNIHQYASTGALYQKRWRFAVVEDAIEFMREWDKTRNQILGVKANAIT